MRGKHQHTRLGKLANDRGRCIGAADAGQSHIHKHKRGMVLAIGLDRGLAVAGFGHHLHVGLHVQ